MTALLLALLLAGAPVSDTGSDTTARAVAQQAAEKAKPKKEKKARDPDKPKKKKTPQTTELAPDEEVDDADVPPAPAATAPRHFVWKQHPSFRSKHFRIDFSAKFQEDGHQSYEGAATRADLEPWELHRNRIGVEGTLFKHIDFEIERELTESELTERDISAGLTPKSVWKDVDVNVDYMKNAQIQVGKFKVPFSLDAVSGESHNDFVYRSAGANYLAPGRDIGAMVHGRFFKKGLSYWTGMFFHDGDNARSKKIQGGDQTFAARVTGKPLRRAGSAFEEFEVGGSMTLTHVTDDSFRPNGLRARTVMTQDDIASPVFVKGLRTRMDTELDWTMGPSSVRAEYMRVTDERLNQSFLDETLPNARYQAWYFQGTYLLTREDKARPMKPHKEFLNGGIGAVEIAGRFERIWFDSVNAIPEEAFSNPRADSILLTGEHVLTLGVNWTLNRFIKLQFNGIREQVSDPDRNPVPNGAAFWSRVFRLQLVL